MAALARRHGALVETVLDGARTTADLGARIAPDLYEREVAYLKAREWARTPDDILWRRTKAGVHLARSQRADAAASLEAMLCRH